MLLIFPVWLALALVARLFGACRGWILRPGSMRVALFRWWGYFVGGLRIYRDTWYRNLALERAADLWRHVFWIEWFSALNQAGRPPARMKRILILKLGHFGDVLHVGPMLERLKESVPDTQLDMLVGPWGRSAVQRWREVSRIQIYPPHFRMFHRGVTQDLPGLMAEWQLLMGIRRSRYDCVISTSTMNLPEWMLLEAAAPSFWIGAESRISQFFGEIDSRTVPYDRDLYEADRLVSLLSLLGYSSEPAPLRFPLHPNEEQFARKYVEDRDTRMAPMIVVAPGAGWLGKIWPPERFAAVVDRLRAALGARIFLVGSKEEKGLADTIQNQAGGSLVDLTGKTSLGEVAALVREADLLLCNDSATLHLAACYGTPSVALFGPTNPSKWAPRGVSHRFIQKEVSCDGCICWHPGSACLHENRCMRAIEVDEVCAACAELLQRSRNRQVCIP